MEQTRSNYTQDRSTNFKHHIPSDIAPVAAMSVEDYVLSEKCKQMSKLRDWYLEAKSVQQTDSVTLRENFSNSRNYVSPNPIQEINHHKGFLIIGTTLAVIVGGIFCFLH